PPRGPGVGCNPRHGRALRRVVRVAAFPRADRGHPAGVGAARHLAAGRARHRRREAPSGQPARPGRRASVPHPRGADVPPPRRRGCKAARRGAGTLAPLDPGRVLSMEAFELLWIAVVAFFVFGGYLIQALFGDRSIDAREVESLGAFGNFDAYLVVAG